MPGGMISTGHFVCNELREFDSFAYLTILLLIQLAQVRGTFHSFSHCRV